MIDQYQEQNNHSDPIHLNLDVEDNLDQQQSEATESIKSYLQHLKGLKSRYRQIIQELQVEENNNIKAAT